MTVQTCKACGETKALEAFERLSSGGHRGTCTACRQAATAARKRAKREATQASPEYQVRMAQRQRDKEEREARKAAAREAALIEREEAKALLLAERAAAREAARLERMEREAAMRDDIRTAMHSGRFQRRESAVKEDPEGLCRIRLAGGAGYISIAEFACRHAEQEATARAARSCRTPEDAAKAVRILEQATPTVERLHSVKSMWRGTGRPSNTFGALDLLGTNEDEDDELDPMAEAFGDWAPAWMQSPALAA